MAGCGETVVVSQDDGDENESVQKVDSPADQAPSLSPEDGSEIRLEKPVGDFEPTVAPNLLADNGSPSPSIAPTDHQEALPIPEADPVTPPGGAFSAEPINDGPSLTAPTESEPSAATTGGDFNPAPITPAPITPAPITPPVAPIDPFEKKDPSPIEPTPATVDSTNVFGGGKLTPVPSVLETDDLGDSNKTDRIGSPLEDTTPEVPLNTTPPETPSLGGGEFGSGQIDAGEPDTGQFGTGQFDAGGDNQIPDSLPTPIVPLQDGDGGEPKTDTESEVPEAEDKIEPLQAKTRTWKARDSKHEVSGQFLGMAPDSNRVRIRTATVDVSIATPLLSDADQGYLLAFRQSGEIQPIRVWSTSDGEYSLEAKFLSMNDSKVRLQQREGRIFTIPANRLSDLDRGYLEALAP